MATLLHSGLIIPESQKAIDFLEGWLRLWKQENKGVSISGLIVRANNDLISFTPSPSTTGIVEPQAATDLFEDLLNNWRNKNPGKTPKSFFIKSNNNQISFEPSPKLPNKRLKPDDWFILPLALIDSSSDALTDSRALNSEDPPEPCSPS